MIKKNIVIILDPAHGVNVKGKCSPDGKHHEYLWSRERVKNLSLMLINMGYEVYTTTNSVEEPELSKRKNFATQVAKGRRKLLLSLHNNAAGNGSKWLDAHGVEVWTTPGVTKADVCAEYFLMQFKKDFPELAIRYNRNVKFERDKEAQFTVLMGADYMGVLIEWLFQDNKLDVELLSDSDMNRRFESSIVDSIEAINDYFKS